MITHQNTNTIQLDKQLDTYKKDNNLKYLTIIVNTYF